MAQNGVFKGFSRQTIQFFEGLSKNNTKNWFEAHRNDYEKHVLEPARAFITAMGKRLRTQFPAIVAVPKVNKSLFRINRDTRFSLDKSPYKTNLGIFLWEGTRPRMECPGFYFHLEPPNLMLGGGLYMFPNYLFDTYRSSVVHHRYGKELAEILSKIGKKEGFQIGGKHYKRVPAGYDPSHPNAEYLLHNGLYVGAETDVPQELYSKTLLDYCWEVYKPSFPLHRWLVALTKRFRGMALNR
jgi:uncharacterized protein (TIGR02453 family)